ncbi:MAG: nucleotidyltransferase domain-containing protein [Deltaproteobacteria bacterium]|nr:nucleotidyltransferase domain-containing protein [Deltaproteobacteria bacterium]
MEQRNKGFISRLSNEIDISEVVLFGSYANGKATERSDIDLVIISDSFLD